MSNNLDLDETPSYFFDLSCFYVALWLCLVGVRDLVYVKASFISKNIMLPSDNLEFTSQDVGIFIHFPGA